VNAHEDIPGDPGDTGLRDHDPGDIVPDGSEDAPALAELFDEGVVPWDAATVLSGAEPSWFELMERVRSSGPDPVFAALEDEELVMELGRRAAGIAASTCRYLELVAELAVRRIWADHGARTPAQWLSFQLGLGASTAADHLRVGLRLRELPAIRERFAEGRISYSKVRAITRIAVPEIEELLLNWSQWATGAEVERIVRAFRSTCQSDDRDRAPDRQRDFRTRRNGDGTTTITVRVPDDEAAAIASSLDRLIDLDDRARDRDASSAEDGSELVLPVPDGTDETSDTSDTDAWISLDMTDHLEAPSDVGDLENGTAPGAGTPSSAEDSQGLGLLGLEGLLALDAAGAGVEISFGRDGGAGGGHLRSGRQPRAASRWDGSEEPEPVPMRAEHRTRGARRADALVDACAVAAADAGIDTSGLDRHTLVLHADLADLQQPETSVTENPNATVPVDLAGGRTRSMSPRVLRRLACEAGVVLVATDGRVPIDVGRRQRRPSAAQRRALTVRDRSCRFPGCDATRSLHAHHVVHWADDGPTDLANLVLICGFHHRFVHDHGWRVVPAAAGTFRFAPPSGDWLPPARQLPEADARSRAERAPADLDGWALRPTHRWGGRDLDLHTAVLVLHQELRAVLPLVDLDLAS